HLDHLKDTSQISLLKVSSSFVRFRRKLKMTLLWRCSTRRNLALPENVQRIESILSGLSDWLGQQLLIDDDAVRDGVLDLTEAGALQRWIQQELDRSMRN